MNSFIYEWSTFKYTIELDDPTKSLIEICKTLKYSREQNLIKTTPFNVKGWINRISRFVLSKLYSTRYDVKFTRWRQTRIF